MGRARIAAAAALVALVALAAVLVLGGGDGGDEEEGAAPRAGALPFRVGIVSEDVFAARQPERRRELRRQARAGIGLVRQTFRWSEIETRPGRYDLTVHDRYVEAVARAGLDLMPIIFAPPAFHSSAPSSGARKGTYPPADPADAARFAAALVRRYGPDGSLWRERPDLAERAIRSWQVWNEPNLPVYWPAGPDAREYAELLRAVSAAIRAEDPGAEVVTAGLAQSRLGIPFERYLADLYEAGAEGTFQALAVHPYASGAAGSVAAVERARELLSGLGDDAAIWVTEIGWASGGPASPFTVGPEGQASRIGAALSELIERRGELGLRGVVYYGWSDLPVYEGGSDFWGLYTGLNDISGRPKPALSTFRAVASTLDP